MEQAETSKDIKNWNNTIKQLDLIDIYRTFHPTTYILFKCSWNIHQDGSLNPYQVGTIIISIYSQATVTEYLQVK